MRQPEGFGLPEDVQFSKFPADIQTHYQLLIQNINRPSNIDKIRETRAAVIAHSLAFTNPRWILGIPNGGGAVAVNVSRHFPDAHVIKAIKLREDMSRENQLTKWSNPLIIPVYSHSEETVRIIAIEAPPLGASIMLVDDVYHLGFAAHEVIGALTRTGLTVAAFAVEREYIPGSLNDISRDYHIPVLASVNSK